MPRRFLRQVCPVHFLCMTLVDRPCFAAIVQCGENYGSVYLDPGLCADSSSLPDVLVQPAERSTRFGESSTHFNVNDDLSRDECAAKVHRVQSPGCPLMMMFGSAYGFPGAGWYKTSIFFVLIVSPKLSKAAENLSTLFCMSPFRGCVEGTVVGEQEVVSFFSLVFARRLGPVVQKPINANLRLNINKEVLFSTPKCCSRLIFGKTLH